jgi:lipoate---protein ligase
VTSGPASLFDVEPLRTLPRSTLGLLQRGDPVVVLGARQSRRDLDDVALERDGVGVLRRHGGGGAVLLRPLDRWVELWLRAGPGIAHHDVRSTAYLVGGWWRAALAAHGVDADVHVGDVRDASEGAVACFAGLGPGELTVHGRKVVGISQWRVREGVLVSSVLAVEAPTDLRGYLAPAAGPVSRLSGAASILTVAPALGVSDVLETFASIATAADPALVVDDHPFM